MQQEAVCRKHVLSGPCTDMSCVYVHPVVDIAPLAALVKQKRTARICGYYPGCKFSSDECQYIHIEPSNRGSPVAVAAARPSPGGGKRSQALKKLFNECSRQSARLCKKEATLLEAGRYDPALVAAAEPVAGELDWLEEQLRALTERMQQHMAVKMVETASGSPGPLVVGE